MKKSPFQTVIALERGALQSHSMGIFESIVVILLYMVVYTISSKLIFGIHFQNKFVEVVVCTLAAVGFYIIVLVVFTKCFCYKTELIHKNRLTKRKVIYSIALILGIFSFGIFLNKLVFIYIDYEFYVKSMKLSFTNIGYVISIFCIVGPFAEELIFRGIVLNGLAKNYSHTKSIIISAILFGLTHQNFLQIITGVFIGIILGWIYLRFNSLILCMIVHSVYNSASIMITAISISTYFDHIKSQNIIVASVFGAVGLATILYLFHLLKKEDDKTLVQNDL